jgi:hypothetical protein
MLLEQLSRLPNAPSVPFQTTPPATEVPEEVSRQWKTFLDIAGLSLLLDYISFIYELVGCRLKRTWIKDQSVAYGMVRILSLIMMKMRNLDLDFSMLMHSQTIR